MASGRPANPMCPKRPERAPLPNDRPPMPRPEPATARRPGPEREKRRRPPCAHAPGLDLSLVIPPRDGREFDRRTVYQSTLTFRHYIPPPKPNRFKKIGRRDGSPEEFQ